MDSADGQNFVLSIGPPAVGWLLDARFPLPDDGDSAGNFLLPTLSAKGYVVMKGL
jgi:hypothetical protein